MVFKKGRMRLKRSRRIVLTNHQVFYATFVVFIFMTFVGLNTVSKELTPTLMEMAQNEGEQAVMYAINYGLSNVTLEEMEHDVDFNNEEIIQSNRDFFNVSTNQAGEAVSVSFDTAAIRDYLFKKTARIQTFMRMVEDGKISIEHGKDRIIRINKEPKGISTSVPLGQVTNTTLFGNLGPKVPIHFEPISDVRTTVVPRLTEKGINNVQIQLVIHVIVHVRIVLPFATKPTPLQQDIPIAEYIYPGKIPKYIDGKPTKQ